MKAKDMNHIQPLVRRLKQAANRYTPSLWICSKIVLVLLLVTACAKDDLHLPNPADPDLVEGEPTTLLMSFNAPDMKVHTRADMGAREREIISLAVFVFDGTTKQTVSVAFHATVKAHVCDVNGNFLNTDLSPDGANYIPIETLTGNNRIIYAIANYDSDVIEDLKAIATEDQLKEAVIQIVGNPLFREFGMMKVGKYEGKVRKETPVKIDFDFLSAKITLKVVNLNSNFKVEGWSVGNIPSKSYVVQRHVISTEPNYHDACDITSNNDYYNDFADQRFDFEQNTPTNTHSSVFYMAETRRGGRIARAEPEGGAASRADYQLKAWYAPPRAAYVVVYGTLTKPDGSTERLTITHYLGANNTDDYNVNRATHYTYTITISTLVSIDIDTNVDIDRSHLRVTPPADPMSLDGHYGFRMIRVHSDEITDADYTVDIEVVQAVNSGIHPQWLDLAITPITMHGVKTNDTGKGSLWQQDGGTNGSYVRPKFIPKKAVRTALAVASTPYAPPSGITIGGDASDYPDNDETLPFPKSIRRMCKKITGLPTKATYPVLDGPMNIMLYAEEYPYNPSATAAAYREAVVRVTLNKNGAPVEYNHFTIRQYPPLRYMKAPGASTHTLLVERIEEYEHMLQPNMPLNFQMLAGIQWGPMDLTYATDRTDGYANTLYGVYTNGPAATAPRTADAYQSSKYGSEGGGWISANGGKIVEPYTGTVQGAPYFNLPDVTNNSHINAIYNLSAARYCHEKNWDTNGDGNIDASETHWYLPSTLEMQQFWVLHELLDLRPNYYWSSNQVDADKAYAFSMMASMADAHRVYNGTPQPFAKSGTNAVNRPRARCVRRAGAGVDPLAPIVRQLPNKNLVVDCSNLPADVHTTVSKLNIEQSDVAAVQRANAKIYKKLEIDSRQPAVTNYYNLHIGNGLCNRAQGWRLPTQREMLLIWAVHPQLEAYGASVFTPFVKDGTSGAETKYWTMTRELSYRYLVDFATGLTIHEPFQSIALTRNYRCVREIP